MATKKNKQTETQAVQPDPLPKDLKPRVIEEGEELDTDWSKPISSSNPPPSKRPLREQPSPVSDGDETLQKDERGLDREQKEAEEEVRTSTKSAERKTRITDSGR